MRPAVRVYVAATAAAALLLTLADLAQFSAWPYGWSVEVLVVLLVLCLLAENLIIQLHSGLATAAGTLPHMAAVFLLPPGLAALLAALGNLVYGIRHGHAPIKTTFNMASVALVVGVAAWLATWLGGPNLLSADVGWKGPVAALAISAVYYFASTSSVAVVVALDQRRSIVGVLRGRLGMRALGEFGMGLLGAMLGLIITQFPFWSVCLLLPAVLLYQAKRAMDDREQRERHVSATNLVSRAVATTLQPEQAFQVIISRAVRDSLRLDGLVLTPLTDPPVFEQQGAWDTPQPALLPALVQQVTEQQAEVVLRPDEHAHIASLLLGGRKPQTTAMAIPFGVGSEPPMGVLIAWRGSADRRFDRFDAAEQMVLRTLADYAAVALESARLLRDASEAETLRAMAALKDEFVGQVSHELRTPLSIVHGYAELIHTGRLRGDQAIMAAIDEIFDNSSAMLRMVGDLLDTARLESGRLTLDLADQDLAPWLTRTVQAFGRTTHTHTVELDIPPTLASTRVDLVRIGQVVHNLLSNAARYAPHGTRICVTARAAGGWVEVRVADQGPGVPLEEQARIFEKFYRGSGGLAAVDARGAGLGLAVARALVEAHHGAIGVNSQPGQGAEFWLRLPVTSARLVLQDRPTPPLQPADHRLPTPEPEPAATPAA